MKRLTLEEIGKLAGVSRATVSRVINDYPHIRPEIRERVQIVIDQTGFKPNALARSLASKRSNIVGLLIPTIVQDVFSDPYFPNLITGIAQGCNANGLVLSLYLFHTLEERRTVTETIIGAGLVDGLIVTTDRRSPGMLETLLASQIPLVVIGEPDDTVNISYVDVDNVMGGYMATMHLIELGYRRIGVISAYINKSCDMRLEGYKKALSEHDIPFDPSLVVSGDFSLESGYEAMKSLLSQHPEAVFAVNDSMALGSLHALHEAKIKVPDDISLIGFDDLTPALQAVPPLTTIRQPVRQTGAQAIALLLKIINGELRQPHHQLLPTTLVVRASSCAVRSIPSV